MKKNKQFWQAVRAYSNQLFSSVYHTVIETTEDHIRSIIGDTPLFAERHCEDYYIASYEAVDRAYAVTVKDGEAHIVFISYTDLDRFDRNEKSPFKRKAPRATDNQPTGGCSLTSLKGQ